MGNFIGEQYVLYTELILKKRSSAVITKTIKLSNRYNTKIDNVNDLDIYPIIKKINGLGFKMGEILPADINVSLTLDTSPEKFAYEFSFFDLLNEYEIHNQQIKIYVDRHKTAQYPLTRSDKLNSYLLFIGIIDSYNFNVNNQELILKITNRTIKTYRPQVTISRDILSDAGVTDLLDVNKFRNTILPMAFGNNITLALTPYTEKKDSTNVSRKFAYIAYPTGLSNLFGTKTFYVWVLNQITNNWVKLKYLEDFILAFLDIGGSGTNISYQGELMTNPLLIPLRSIWNRGGAYPLNDLGENQEGVLIQRIDLTFIGGSDTTINSEAVISCKIVENLTGDTNVLTNNEIQIRTIAESVIAKTHYQAQYNNSFSFGSEFVISFYFEKPVVIEPNRIYCVLLEESHNDNTKVAIEEVNSSYDGFIRIFKKINTDAGDTFTVYYDPPVISTLRGSKLWLIDMRKGEESYTDDNGLTFGYILVKALNPTNDFEPEPDLDGLRLVYQGYGILDDSSGTITGSSKSVIEKTNDVVKVLSGIYSSGSWKFTNIDGSNIIPVIVDDTFKLEDSAAFQNGGRYEMNVSGVVKERTNYQAINKLGREFLFRVYKYISENYKSVADGEVYEIYHQGIRRSTVGTLIEPVHGKVKRIFTESFKTSTITAFQAEYANRLINIKEIEEFLNVLTTESGTKAINLNIGDELIDMYIREEKDLYGENKYNSITNYQYVADTNTMKSIVKILLSLHKTPNIFIEMEIQFRLFETMKLLDVFEVVSPFFSSQSGTSFKTKKPYDNRTVGADTTTEIVEGATFRMDNYQKHSRVRVQVESINYNFSNTEPLTITFIGRVMHPKGYMIA